MKLLKSVFFQFLSSRSDDQKILKATLGNKHIPRNVSVHFTFLFSQIKFDRYVSIFGITRSAKFFLDVIVNLLAKHLVLKRQLYRVLEVLRIQLCLLFKYPQTMLLSKKLSKKFLFVSICYTQKQLPEFFYKKKCSEKFRKIHRSHFSIIFLRILQKIFKNTFFTEHFQSGASVCTKSRSHQR